MIVNGNIVHEKVAEALKDLLPHFQKCSTEDPMLDDHPLQAGRIRNSASNQDEEQPMHSSSLSCVDTSR